jgi:hypothetical protein
MKVIHIAKLYIDNAGHLKIEFKVESRKVNSNSTETEGKFIAHWIEKRISTGLVEVANRRSSLDNRG